MSVSVPKSLVIMSLSLKMNTFIYDAAVMKLYFMNTGNSMFGDECCTVSSVCACVHVCACERGCVRAWVHAWCVRV